MSGVIVLLLLLIVLLVLVIKYCEKTLRIVLSSIIVLIALYCVVVCIDMSRVNSLKEPIFAWDTKCKCLNEKQFQGLGYKVEIYYSENGNLIKIEMTMFGNVIAGAITNTNGEDKVSSELNNVYNKVGDYFGDEKADRSNLASNSLDTENNVVIVELIDNSKEKQESFLKNAKIDSKDSKYIKFQQGGPYITSNKCNSDGLQIITGQIKEINNSNYKTKNSKGNIIINIISGLDSEDDIVFYHNSNIEFKIGQKVRVGHNGNRNESNPPQAFAECVELLQ